MNIQSKSITVCKGEIYFISCPNGGYIGQTTRGFNVRFKEHLKYMRAGKTTPLYTTPLYWALRSYYSENPNENKIKTEIIAIADSLEELNYLETYYITKYNTYNDHGKNYNGYNMTIGGDGCPGYSFTEKQKQRCRDAQQKRNEEHPEIAKNHSKYMKQRAIDNPNIGLDHGIHMVQVYNDPDKRKKMSEIKIQQNKDNPEMATVQSELKLMQYNGKDGVEIIEKIRNKSIQQWQDPEKRKKIIDEKRNRFSKSFNVYKDGILISSFDYVPDCAFNLFGKKNDSNISAVLNGRKKSHKGYVFKYN